MRTIHPLKLYPGLSSFEVTVVDAGELVNIGKAKLLSQKDVFHTCA